MIGLFALSEDCVAVVITDEVESCFYELTNLFFGMSNGGCEVVISEAYELGVEPYSNEFTAVRELDKLGRGSTPS